jgi:hypothetical protein
MFASKDTLLTRPSGYSIARSVRTRSSASAYFNRTLTTPTSGTKWTWSGWVKRGILTAGTGTAQILISAGSATAFFRFSTTDTLISGWTGASNLETTQVFRDPSAWYHIMLVVDTTQATASNRVKYYVNGVQITAFSTTDYPTQNSTTTINSAVAHNIGAYTSSSQYFDGYLTEINFIDGQALTPSSFGTTNAITGVWQPAKYTGTYGTNGFYLNFSDNSNNTAATIGKDYSGNGNNWTPNNISVTAGVTYDSMTDVPTLTSATAANYAVANPLANGAGTLSNGNLNLLGASSAWGSRISTIGVDSGKWYFEITPLSGSATQGVQFGISSLANPPASLSSTGAWCYYGFDGKFYANGAAGVAYGATVADNDVVGVAFDRDNGTLTFYKNNTSQGVAQTGLTSGTYYLGFACYGTATASINFGQRPFSYTPPTGYVALNTFNLPDSTIKNGAGYMSAVLYTGDGNTNRSITGVGFQTDFNWTKSRSSASYSHQLADSVRGWSKYLYSNATNAEGTDATNHIQSVNSDGYVINSGASFNANGVTYVAWDWKAGTTSASNTNGSITSTVSVGATQGFSIVTYTGNGTAGATIGHGLGVVPTFIIVKNRSSAQNWLIYSAVYGANMYGYLNLTNAWATDTTGFNNVTPTSTVFSVGTALETNGNGNSLVAYCFTPVKGYSAFGSYTGNNSNDGPFVYLGFRPRFVMFKDSTSAGAWMIMDSSRETYNVEQNGLAPNNSNGESTYSGTPQVDFLSNGFKIRATNANQYWNNVSGNIYIYAAFAENPFKNALAR